MTVDDIYLWVVDRWRHPFPERGRQSFEKVIREAADEEADRLSTKAKTAVNRLITKRDQPRE